jgi:zinc transporter ZupT
MIYWIRLALGIVAGLLGAVWNRAAGALQNPVETNYVFFFNSLTAALIIYLVSYYVFKAKFRSEVEKQSKIMTMGIGIYFFTWLVSWILTFTFL